MALVAAPRVHGQTPTAKQSEAAPAATPPPPVAPPTPEEASYLIGVNFGEQLHRLGITDQVSVDTVARGLRDGLGGKKTEPADQQRLQAYVRSVVEAIADKNKAAAKEYLARNGKEKGVKTTASGLQYKILAAGDPKGVPPQTTDQVTVEYRGKLIDGSEFDSSYARGKPATFTIGGVIKGWQEALVMMKPGAKWQLFVPPELAYDTSPRPGIPAGSLLIFDVELVSVKATPPILPPTAMPHPNAMPPGSAPPPGNQGAPPQPPAPPSQPK